MRVELLFLCLTLACSASRENDDVYASRGDGISSGEVGGLDDGGDPLLDVGGDTTSETSEEGDCECAPHADLIHLLGDNASLWSFNPEALQFKKIGELDCDIGEDTYSMGVSRDGSAWIMFRPSGDIYTVNINSPDACTDPGYTPDQIGYELFGMAYAADSSLDPCDRLYAHSFDGRQWSEGSKVGVLGRLGPDLQMVSLGDIDYNGGELTGTGDGRLYAFAGVPSAKLIQYDKQDADVLETIPLDLDLTYAFAFAFWGGDFYFFTEAQGTEPTVSKVTKLDYDKSDGEGMELTTVVPKAPLRVVGAGVSTCAPYEPIE